MSRRDAREVAFKLIFSYTFNEERNDEELQEYIEGLDADDSSYISVVYNGATSHYHEILKEIENVAEGFSLSRIFKVDMAIMVLAIYEIKYVESIPYKVSVDEALKLAEKYATEKSVKFINGILSKFGE